MVASGGISKVKRSGFRRSGFTLLAFIGFLFYRLVALVFPPRLIAGHHRRDFDLKREPLVAVEILAGEMPWEEIGYFHAI